MVFEKKEEKEETRMKLDYLKFAVNNLKHRGIRSWLTMIGIFIGIAAVVALMGLGEGLRFAVMSQFSSFGTDLLAVTASGGFGPPGTGVINPLTDKEFKAVESVPGVDAVAGRLLQSVKISFNRHTSFGYAVSMPDGDGRKLVEETINAKAFKGRLLEDGDSGVVFVGYAFYDNPDRFGKRIDVGDKIVLQDREYRVIGILEKKGNVQFDTAVILNDADMRDLFDISKDRYDIIAVRFNENSDVDKIKLDIEKRLRKVRGVDEGEEDFSVQTPGSILESVNSVILGVQIFVFVIAAISILVGGIGIMNTMYTAVVERTKEIGIMKSIGATNSTIFSLFFFESGLLGSVGGLVGAILGLSAAKSFAFVGRLALGSDLIVARVSPWLFFAAVFGAFLLGSFFGTLPAIQASKLNPVDALRFAK